MKNLLLFTLLFIVPTVFAQPNDRPNRGEKIEELKIAFITNELNLSTTEAQKFWPVYNEMEGKIREIKIEQKELARDMQKNGDKYSESEFKTKSNAYLETNIKEAQIRKSYHDKIADVIGYKKATKLISSEQRFKRELLKKLNQRDKKIEHRPEKDGPRPN